MALNPTELPSNRSFGIFFFIIFFVGSVYFWYINVTILSTILLVISIAILLSALLYPSFLTPLNRAWFRLGLALSIIISPIVMGIIYFLIFTPIALTLKCIGRDELKLRTNKQSTHWQKRPVRMLTRKSHFLNQF